MLGYARVWSDWPLHETSRIRATTTAHRSTADTHPSTRVIMAPGVLALVVTLVSLAQLQLKVDAFTSPGARGSLYPTDYYFYFKFTSHSV